MGAASKPKAAGPAPGKASQYGQASMYGQAEPKDSGDSDGQSLDAVLGKGEYPVLRHYLDGQTDDRLRNEIINLVRSFVRNRAPRKSTTRMARLVCGDYDEVVMVKDLSATGLRLLVNGNARLDLADAMNMNLVVGEGQQTILEVPIALVRIAGTDPPHLALGCRFLIEGEALEHALEILRSTKSAPGTGIG